MINLKHNKQNYNKKLQKRKNSASCLFLFLINKKNSILQPIESKQNKKKKKIDKFFNIIFFYKFL